MMQEMLLSNEQANFKFQSHVHTWNPNEVKPGEKFYKFNI